MALRGRPLPLRVRQKISLALRNRVFSEEHRRRISEAKKGTIRRDLKGKTLDAIYGPLFAADIRRRRGLGIQKAARIRADTRSKNPNRRQSYREKDWRRAVLKRDARTCQRCGTNKRRMHAHHLRPWNDAPKKRFLLTNGVTLCIPCHNIVHSSRIAHRKPILIPRRSRTTGQLIWPTP